MEMRILFGGDTAMKLDITLRKEPNETALAEGTVVYLVLLILGYMATTTLSIFWFGVFVIAPMLVIYHICRIKIKRVKK